MILNISGPSGSGKTTLAKHLCEEYQNCYSRLISYTTRSQRYGEIEGVDYYFITEFEYNLYSNWQLARNSESGLYGTKDEDIRNYSTPFLLTTFPPSGVVKMRNLGLVVQPFFLDLSVDKCIERMELRGDDQNSILQRLEKDNIEVSVERIRQTLPIDNIIVINASLDIDIVAKKFFELSQHLL